MRKGLICAMLLAASVVMSAQSKEGQWELGVIGGFGISPDLTVKNATTSASTGFKNGMVIGAFAGQDTYRYWSGEANYLYRQSDLKLEGSGKSASFDAHTHIITGDFLGHFRPVGARMRPFVSFGGGVKVIQGTGIESATQPLGNLAALTATKEVLAVGEIGAGVKYQINKRMRLRVQVRDFISSSPKDVIAAAPGASLTGIVNDFVATGAFSITW